MTPSPRWNIYRYPVSTIVQGMDFTVIVIDVTESMLDTNMQKNSIFFLISEINTPKERFYCNYILKSSRYGVPLRPKIFAEKLGLDVKFLLKETPI